jgi:hypothetical protein
MKSKFNRCNNCYDSNEHLRAHIPETSEEHAEWILSLNLHKRIKDRQHLLDDKYEPSSPSLYDKPELWIISVLVLLLSFTLYLNIRLRRTICIQTAQKSDMKESNSTIEVPSTPAADHSIKHRFIQQARSPTIDDEEISPIEHSNSPNLYSYSPCNIMFSGSIVGSETTTSAKTKARALRSKLKAYDTNHKLTTGNVDCIKPMSALASQLFDSDSDLENINPNSIEVRVSKIRSPSTIGSPSMHAESKIVSPTKSTDSQTRIFSTPKSIKMSQKKGRVFPDNCAHFVHDYQEASSLKSTSSTSSSSSSLDSKSASTSLAFGIAPDTIINSGSIRVLKSPLRSPPSNTKFTSPKSPPVQDDISLAERWMDTKPSSQKAEDGYSKEILKRHRTFGTRDYYETDSTIADSE